jgi:hypothetical protein
MSDSRRSAPQPTGAEQQVSAQGEAAPGDNGVALRRLLAVATLTPAQAAVLARDLADELALLATHGRLPDGVDDRSVLVTGHGQLRVMASTDSRDGESSGYAVPDPLPPVRAAVGLIRQLDGNVRGDGPTVRSLARVDEAADLAELAGRVQDAAKQLVGDQQHRVRQEIAAAVMAITGNRYGAEPARPAGAPTSWRPSSRHAWHRRRRGPWRSMLAVLLLIALAGAVWWGAPRAWPELQRGWDSLFAADPPPRQLFPLPDVPAGDAEDAGDEAADEDVEARPADVEPPAPESAGPVTGVSIDREGGPCLPDEHCVVRVQVDLERAGTARRVDWEIHIVDRCTDEVQTRQGVTVTAQPGWTQVWGNSAIDLPSGTALAIVAVTDSPASAASSPLLVPADGTC